MADQGKGSSQKSPALGSNSSGGGVRAIKFRKEVGQARTAFPARQSPKALCPSMTRAPVSHRSREGIPGSDRAKLPQQTATGGHCVATPHLSLWRILHSQIKMKLPLALRDRMGCLRVNRV